MQARCHYTKAVVDGVGFDLYDDAYVKVSSLSLYIYTSMHLCLYYIFNSLCNFFCSSACFHSFRLCKSFHLDVDSNSDVYNCNFVYTLIAFVF